MKLAGKRIAVLVAAGFEDLEYRVTVMRLREEGAEVVSLGQTSEEVIGKHAPHEPAFREGRIVWGRMVNDVPDFCRELIGALAADVSTGAQEA